MRPPLTRAPSSGEAAPDNHRSEVRRAAMVAVGWQPGVLQSLTARYREAVHRLHDSSRERLNLSGMAAWAIRNSVSGWALVGNGQIKYGNASFRRFGQVGRDDAGPWKCVNAQGGRALDGLPSSFSLRQVVIVGAELVLGDEEPLRLRYARGTQVVELLLEPIRDLPVGGSAVLAVVSDVTALVRAETQAHDARERLERHDRERIVSELALGVAHDVHNLLDALGMRLALVAADPSCQRAQGENLAAVHTILHEASSLITRLRGVGTRSTHPQAIDLAEVMNDALEIARTGLRLGARQSGVELRVESELASLPAALALGDDLRQVFINLLINARDAMPRGGTIRITGKALRGQVVVRVEDEGSGIAPEHLLQIFDAFYTTKGQQGLGLGLTLARAVVERSGGTITASNRPEGGARLEVRLPRPAVTRRNGVAAKRRGR